MKPLSFMRFVQSYGFVAPEVHVSVPIDTFVELIGKSEPCNHPEWATRAIESRCAYVTMLAKTAYGLVGDDATEWIESSD